MRHLLQIVFLSLLFVSCFEARTPLTFKSGLINNPGNSSIEAYKNSVYPLVKTNCIQCHADKISPFLAHENVENAYNVTLSAFKVDLKNVEESRIYKRLKNDLHNCWSDCSANAEEMLSAIRTWANASQDTVARIKTTELNYSDVTSSPATLASSLFVEAENLALSGRFMKYTLSGASGLFAVTSPKVPLHPNGQRARYGYMDSQCKMEPVSDTYRPYHLVNNQHHFPDPNSHHPYYMKLSYHLIRPDKRDEYLALLKSKGDLTQTDYSPFLWGAKGFTQGNPSLPMVDIVRGSSSTVVSGSPNIFPDGYSLEKYYAQLAAGNLPANYFAPRFDGKPYFLTSKQLRMKLGELEAEHGFIRKAMWGPMANRIKEYFYSGAVERPTALASADYFSGGLKGEAGFNALFPLKYKDAANIIYQDGDNVIREIDKYYYVTLGTDSHYYSAVPMNGHEETRVVPVNPDTETNLSILQNYYKLSGSFLYIYNAIVPGSTNTATYRNQPYDLSNILWPNAEFANMVSDYKFYRFAELIHPVITSAQKACISCHNGQLSTAPAFAVPGPRDSFNVLTEINGIDFDEPISSALYVKMMNYHSSSNNCGDDKVCEAIGEEILGHVNTIKSGVAALGAQGSGNTFIKSFSDAEQTPGRMDLQLQVAQTNNYRFYAKVRHTGPTIGMLTKYAFQYQLIDSAGNIVPLTRNNAGTETNLPASCHESLIINSTTPPVAWMWAGSGQNHYFKLSPGLYTLRVFEGREGVDIDEVGLTSDLTGAPVEPTEKASTQTKTFSYDIEQLTGVSGAKFLIDIDDYYGYYKFTRPRISGAADIWINGIQVLINNSTTPYDVTFKTVKKRVSANDSSSLASAPLLVLKQFGIAQDKFSIQFDELRRALPSDINQVVTGPTNSNGRYCRDLPYFAKNVLPIFSKTGTVIARGQRVERTYFHRYVANFKAGTYSRRRTFEWIAGFRNHERCFDCHNGGVPKFVMSENPAEMCEIIMSRVNFDDPMSSNIFRGIYSQFGHNEVFFPEIPEIDANGEWPDNPDSWNGKKSSWISGDVFDTYESYADLFNPLKSATCSPAHVTDPNDIRYLKTFVGTVKRQNFVLNNTTLDSAVINTPFTQYDWDLYLAGQPLPPTSFYNAGGGADALTPDQLKNIMVDLYPADYICGYENAVPLTQRLQPGSHSECYNLDHSPRRSICRNLKTPDGKYAQYGTSLGGGNTGVRALYHNHTSIVPKLKPNGENADIPETGKERVRLLILNWIKHEKNLRQASGN